MSKKITMEFEANYHDNGIIVKCPKCGNKDIACEDDYGAGLKELCPKCLDTRQSPKAQNNHELTELSHMEFIQGNPEKAIEIATKALKDKGHPVPPSIADVFLDLINRYNEPYSGLMEVVSAINILIKEDNLAVEIKEESK